MKMKNFKIKNLKDKGEIYIYGVVIDDTDASWLIQGKNDTIGYQFPAEIKQQLDELKGLPIDVHIASDGGDVAAGIAIYNMLSTHDAPVTVYIDSWGASIASFIAFAGQKIIMPENTFLMIHNPAGGAFGSAEYIRSVANWLDKIRDMLAETYSKAGNKSVDEIKKLMDAETWLTAKEAKELWQDKIEIVASNNIEAVAQLKSEFKNAPEALKQKMPDKATESPVASGNVPEGINPQEEDINDYKKNIINLLMEAYKI